MVELSSNIAGAQATTAQPNALNVMGKDEFLKLLVTQLSYQDPLSPIKNEDFSAQMAQFSSLEQMQQLNATMKALYSQQSLADAAHLIGKQVVGLSMEQGTLVSGTVQSVSRMDGKPVLSVGGHAVALQDITHIQAVAEADNG